MRQLFLDGVPVTFIDGPAYFVLGLYGVTNPGHFYTTEAHAAASARGMAARHGSIFFVAQCRSIHQMQLEMVSEHYFGRPTWPEPYRPPAAKRPSDKQLRQRAYHQRRNGEPVKVEAF